MTINRLLEYDWAKDFALDRISENVFLGILIEKIKTDRRFRKATQIISLENAELKKVVDALKKLRVPNPSLKEISAQELYIRISFIKNIFFADRNIQPIYSKDANAPIIIIIQSVHKLTGWEVDFDALETLRKNFGFNFVGIEGWAGQDADRQRGRLIVNGEVPLVLQLISNKNYKILGLEHPRFQIQALEFFLFFDYVSEEVYKENVIKSLSEFVSRSQIETFLKDVRMKIFLYISIYCTSRESSELRKFQVKLAEEVVLFLMKFIPRNLSIRAIGIHLRVYPYVSSIENICMGIANLYGVTNFADEILDAKKKVLYNKYSPFYSQIKFRLVSRNTDMDFFLNASNRVVGAQREAFAVTKMLASMKKIKRKIGIAVFGAAHTEGLVKEFRRQAKDINIMVFQVNQPKSK